jgi:MFS family permease
MAVSGTATSFTYLLITRVFLGGVTAAASPAVASLTGDYFPPRDRANIYGMVLAGELLGTGVGFFIAGEVSSLINWRWSFYFMAGVSLLALWVVWRYLEEPARGGQNWIVIGQQTVENGTGAGADANEGKAAQEQSDEAGKAQQTIRTSGIEPRRELILDCDPNRRSIWWAIGYLLRIPTYRLLIIASSLGYYFFAGIRGFAMVYLTQHYDVSRGTVSALAIVIGIGALAGIVLSGRLSGRLLDRGYVAARILIPGIALFASALFFAPGIWTTNVVLGVGLLTLGGAALGAANPPIDAARLDIVHPRLWGRGESGRMALRALLEGGAPILFGAMSGWLGGSENGLKWTYLVMLIPVLVASALAIPAYRSYPRDVATASASVERLREMEGQRSAG